MGLLTKIRIWFENSFIFEIFENLGYKLHAGFRKGNRIGSGVTSQKGLFKNNNKKLKERLGT